MTIRLRVLVFSLLAVFPWLGIGLVAATPCLSAETNGATWRFHLVEDATGEPTMAMVCIRNLDDGTVRLPPDGHVCERVSMTSEFYKGLRFDRRDKHWIGPVRKTLGVGNNKDRSYVYGEKPSVVYWDEPVMYQTRSDFSISLPPGHYHISVSHGMEYVPVAEPFVVKDGEDRERTIRLHRWVNLAESGWYSGDVHVHHPTTEEAHRQFLLGYAAAEDLHVVNVLEMGHHGGTEFKQVGFGEEFRVHDGDYWLVSGQEEPRSTFGHIIGLNMDALARDVATYDFYDLAFARIHQQQGALVGFAHFSWRGCSLPRGFPWYVTTNELDFVELQQFNMLNRVDYYDYLNLGFRLTAAAGSDIPWGSTLGEVRTYVYTGDPLDIDRWFAALKAGHTFVSNGPAISFTVNGQLPGTEITAKAGDTLRVRAKTWGHVRVGAPVSFSVVGGDGVVKETKQVSSDQRLGVREMQIDIDVPVNESTWLAASTECGNSATAHTTPVYVIVDGRPTWNAKRGPGIIERQLEAIAKIKTEFRDKSDPRSQGIKVRLAKARQWYAKLAAEMSRAE